MNPGDKRTAVRFIPDIRSVAIERDAQQSLASISPVSPYFGVIPAQAGTPAGLTSTTWVPAFAGMTVCGMDSRGLIQQTEPYFVPPK